MPRESDDDALRWEGDDDPTLAPGWKVVGSPAPPETGAHDGDGTSADGTSAVDEDAAAADADEASDAVAAGAPAARERRQAGSVELVVLGILGGVYLLYTVGWLVTVLRTDAPGASVIGDAMYVAGLWLAVLAPALWFGLVQVAVRKPVLRLVWLVVGAVVLVPLPFILGVSA